MMPVDGAEFASAAVLLPGQQAAWREQARYVAENSAFYRALWDGRTPPGDLRDLPELPLSDKAHLRLSQAAHPPFGDYLATPRYYGHAAAPNIRHHRPGDEPRALGA